jgi:hypothetical protein
MNFFQRLFSKKDAIHYEGENAPLVHAIHQTAIDDSPSTRQKLYEALLTSTFIVPTPELPGQLRGRTSVRSNGDLKVDMVGFTDKEGKKNTPAFTDAEALRAWDPNTPSLRVPARAYFQLVQQTNFDAIVINPFDPVRKMVRPGGWIRRAEFDLLAKGVAPLPVPPNSVRMQLKPGQKLFIGIPAMRPSQEIEKLLQVEAGQHREILELHIFQMATHELGSSTVVGIVIDKAIPNEQEESIPPALGNAIRTRLGEGVSMDFMLLKGITLEDVRRNGIAIYRRE